MNTLCECGCGKPAPIAQENHSRYGWVKGKPKRFIRGHAARLPVEKRFWSKVDKRGPDDCWEWQAGKNQEGYGRFWHDNDTGGAHRYSYELHHGPIPEGFGCFHRCDNPSCVNPAHLFVGPNGINSADMANKGRSLKGEQHNLAKLNRDAVIEIRERYTLDETQTSLAKEFGVNQTTISCAILKKTWAHV